MKPLLDSDPIGRDYVRLALRIERHFEGFVDSYYGPPEVKAQVEAEGTRDVAALRREAAALAEAITKTEMDDRRRGYLNRQVRAMDTVLRRLAGEEMSLAEEAQGCFNITPERIDESEFEAALREIETLLPGPGDLPTRLADWRRQFELSQERSLPVLHVALAETRRRTARLFDLPEGEAVDLQLVTDKPWGGYNWYLGNYRSRVDVNTDLPVRADRTLDLVAHEAYPGHHTEHVIKEQRWYRQAGRLEHSIQLLIAPESFVAEAIATTAFDVIFPDQAELAGWLADVFYPAAAIHVDVRQQLRLGDALEKLAGVSGNAAFLLHEDRRPEADVLDYLRHYDLLTDQEARQRLRFISDPLCRTYIFNYFYGRHLLKQAGEAGSLLDVFRWAVSEPVTPSAIAARGLPETADT